VDTNDRFACVYWIKGAWVADGGEAHLWLHSG
jgi:hypothetical protein